MTTFYVPLTSTEPYISESVKQRLKPNKGEVVWIEVMVAGIEVMVMAEVLDFHEKTVELVLLNSNQTYFQLKPEQVFVRMVT